MKLLTSPAKNWWQPSPPREARAPGLALGKPPGFTTLAPLSCFVDRASSPTDHGTCFDPSCHWTLLYQFGSIKMPVHAIFLPNSILLQQVCFPLFQVGIFQAPGHFQGTPGGHFNYTVHAWKHIMRQAWEHSKDRKWKVITAGISDKYGWLNGALIAIEVKFI